MSKYLDDMNLPAGKSVICKANLSAPHFTVGRVYVTLGGHKLVDDLGHTVTPSARFEMAA